MYKDWPKLEVPSLMQRCSHCREKSTLACNLDPPNSLPPVLFLLMQAFCSCNLWRKRFVLLGGSHSSVHVCAQGRGTEPLLATWTVLKEEPPHLSVVSQSSFSFWITWKSVNAEEVWEWVRIKGFFGFQWLDAGWGPARAHGSSITAKWLGRRCHWDYLMGNWGWRWV